MDVSVKQKIGGALQPDEVDIAAAAFKAALSSLGTTRANAYAVRRCLARYISAHALMGELDVETLRDGAIRYLDNGFSLRDESPVGVGGSTGPKRERSLGA
jgi:hypothetical protein